MRLKFENKVLIVLVLILIFGLSIINALSILTYKNVLESMLKKEAFLYSRIIIYIGDTHVPEYIKITDRLPDTNKYNLVGIYGDLYVSIDKSYLSRKLISFGGVLFIWESIFIMLIVLLFYFTIIKYIRQLNSTREYLELLLLTLSHKLGNFLSSQQINLSIIKSSSEEKAISRLERAFLTMEEDFFYTIQIIERLKEGINLDRNIERINLKELLEEIIASVAGSYKNKKISLSLKEVYVYGDKYDIKNAFFAIIENAFRYSKNKIRIKVCESEERVYVVVRNDVFPTSRGTGIGLTLAKKLLHPYKGTIYFRLKNTFILVVSFAK